MRLDIRTDEVDRHGHGRALALARLRANMTPVVLGLRARGIPRAEIRAAILRIWREASDANPTTVDPIDREVRDAAALAVLDELLSSEPEEG